MDGSTDELDAASSYGSTAVDPSSALNEAFHNKNIAEVDYIIQSNKDDPSLYETVKSCIMQCARGGKENADILMTLMKYPHITLGSSVSSAEFIDTAVRSADLEIFEAMLRVGWDPSTPLRFIGDALTFAIARDNLSLVCWLLDHGADYQAYHDGCLESSILAIATQYASPAVVERLLAAGVPIKDSRALESAVYDGRIDSITCLLDHGGDINEIAAEISMWVENGCGAALHVAAQRGHLRAVQFLINRGANVGLRDSMGRTALDLAIMEERSDIVNLLKSISCLQ